MLHTHIQDALTTDSPGITRALIQALTHDIRVAGRDQVKPIFRVSAGMLKEFTDQLGSESAETVTGVRFGPRPVWLPNWQLLTNRRYK